MEYEIIRDLSEEQIEKIKKEYRRSFNFENTIAFKVNGVYVGFGVAYFISGRLTVEYYLFHEFQNQGYGSALVSIVSDAIGSDYPLYDSLYLLIYKENVPSMKVALKSGYKMECLDWEFRNMIEDDMPEYYVLSKKNSYYKELALKKA